MVGAGDGRASSSVWHGCLLKMCCLLWSDRLLLPPGSGRVLLGRRPCLRGEGGLGVFGGQLQSRGRERGRELLLLVGLLSSFLLKRHWIFLVNDRDAQCFFFGAGSSLRRAGFALLHPRFGGREHVEGATRGKKGPRGSSAGCKRGGLKKGESRPGWIGRKKKIMRAAHELARSCEPLISQLYS